MGLARVSLALIAGCAAPLPPEVAATVDGEIVPASRFHTALAALAVRDRGPAVGPRHRARVLDDLVDEALLRQRAAELGLQPLDATPERAVLDAATSGIAAPSESDLRSFYGDHPDLFAREAAWQVSAWRFAGPRAEAEAREVASALAEGRPVSAPSLEVPATALPFDALVQYVGPSTARAAIALEPGEVARPTPYASGWLVARLDATVPGEPPEFSAIRDAVALAWRAHAEQEAHDALLAALRASARVRINAAVRDGPIPAEALARAAAAERRPAE